MMIDFTIEPSCIRTEFLVNRMQQKLCESLLVLAGCIELDEFPEVAHLHTSIARLQNGFSPSPTDYGQYYKLAEAVLAENELGVRAALVGFNTTTGSLPFFNRWSEPSVSTLQDVAADRFGPVASLFHAVEPTPFALFQNRMAEALAFLENCWPKMATEISMLVKQVLVATGAKSASENFDGGSHYQLWGLLILNPDFHKTPLALAEVLVHEASHLLLFGFAIEEPLVLNPDSQRFPSPLRRDPRPMDGIFHSVYVSARMALTMDRIASNQTLNANVRKEAARMRDEDILNFFQGAKIMRMHANFTGTGQAVFSAAESAILALD